MTASAAALCAHQQLTTLATSCAIGDIVGDSSCSISGRDNVGAACIRCSRLNFSHSDNVSAAHRSGLSLRFSGKVSAASTAAAGSTSNDSDGVKLTQAHPRFTKHSTPTVGL